MHSAVWNAVAIVALTACGSSSPTQPSDSERAKAKEPSVPPSAEPQAEPSEPPSAEPSVPPSETVAPAVAEAPSAPPATGATAVDGGSANTQAQAAAKLDQGIHSALAKSDKVVLSAFSGSIAREARLTVTKAAGGLDSEATLRTLKLAQAEFDACANEAQTFGASPSTYSLTVSIAPNGKPTTTASKGLDKAIATCIRKLAERIQFPQAKRATNLLVQVTVSEPGVGGFGMSGMGLQSGGSTGIGGGFGVGSGGGVYGLRPRTIAGRTPSVRPGKPAVQGALDKEIIRRVMRQHLPAVRRCYEQQLAKKPKLAGRIRTGFTIGAQGTVTNVTADGLGDEVSKCVTRILKKMRFPKPKSGSVTVRYPFTFSST